MAQEYWKNKHVVVTGGAFGIGRCLVEEFSKEGAVDAFLDKEKPPGEALETALRQKGYAVHFFPGDAGQEKTLESFAAFIKERLLDVDVLINNACLSHKGILSGCTYDEFNEVLRVGVAAPYYLTSLLLPLFSENASVLNLSSTRARQSQSDTESYTAAKGGISALTHALSVSLKGKVRVNSISPGWIDTGEYQEHGRLYDYTKADIEQHPSRRVGNPMDIFRAACFLCDEKNSFINGQNLTVDGGMSRLMVYAGDEGWSYQG